MDPVAPFPFRQDLLKDFNPIRDFEITCVEMFRMQLECYFSPSKAPCAPLVEWVMLIVFTSFLCYLQTNQPDTTSRQLYRDERLSYLDELAATHKPFLSTSWRNLSDVNR
jgi:hypothetical protein